MLGRLINGHQQTDPKRRVKAQEHRHDVTMPAKPPRVPQIVEQEIAPKAINKPTNTNTTCKARSRFISSSVLCDARLLPPFLLQIVRLSAVMRPILEPCEHPQCEQNASPPRIGLPQELQGPRRGPRNTK